MGRPRSVLSRPLPVERSSFTKVPDTRWSDASVPSAVADITGWHHSAARTPLKNTVAQIPRDMWFVIASPFLGLCSGTASLVACDDKPIRPEAGGHGGGLGGGE